MWKQFTLNWNIPRERLGGAQPLTLESDCMAADGVSLYLRLAVRGPGDVAKLSLCAKAPTWTPVRVDQLRIGILEYDYPKYDNAIGVDAYESIGFQHAASVLLEADGGSSADHSLGGALSILKADNPDYVYDEDNSDYDEDVSRPNYDEVEMTRADLLANASMPLNEIRVSATFRINRLTSVSLGMARGL